MSSTQSSARRQRVERNIYKRTSAAGRTVYEVGYRDSAGRQRWKVVNGGITAARAERDDVLGRKGKGQAVQPNPRLRFGEAADRWLAEQVSELRPATQASYRNSVEVHLRPRWARTRLDAITVDDAARLVRELRAERKAEWTISTILRAASRIFQFARRRMNWHGENPLAGLENGERKGRRHRPAAHLPRRRAGADPRRRPRAPQDAVRPGRHDRSAAVGVPRPRVARSRPGRRRGCHCQLRLPGGPPGQAPAAEDGGEPAHGRASALAGGHAAGAQGP